MQIGTGVTEIADLQIVNQSLHLLLAEQQRRHRDHGDAVVGNAYAEVELGENSRPQSSRSQVVHYLDGSLAARQQQNEDGNDAPDEGVEAVVHRAHDRDHDRQRQYLDAAEVELIRMTAQEFWHSFAEGQANSGASAKMPAAFADEVIADMRFPPCQPRIGRRVLLRLFCQFQRCMRNLYFAAVGVFSEMRYGLAIHLAALVINARVGFRWVLRQHALEDDQRLQQLLPWRFREIAHTADQHADVLLRLFCRVQHLLTARDVLLQDSELQRRNQQRELGHVQRRERLEGLN